jgi:hypothetical protein
MVAPGESGLPGTSRSSAAHGGGSIRSRRTVAHLMIAGQAIKLAPTFCNSSYLALFGRH